METRINGLRYNTETAKKIAYWGNSYPVNDFNSVEEWLYKKKTGEYFLYGEGGANTEYSEMVGQNEWSGGSRITPLTFDEAQKWMEKAVNADPSKENNATYDREFLQKRPVGETVTVTVKIDKALKDKLDKLAARQSTTASQIIANLIDNEFN